MQVGLGWLRMCSRLFTWLAAGRHLDVNLAVLRCSSA